MPQVIRVLHIARYRDSSMERKVELLAQQPDLELSTVRPSNWRDVYHPVAAEVVGGAAPRLSTSLLGNPNDPHRALYGTWTFGMVQARPHIIHVEEEPDSLAALQVVIARRLLAPQAKLVLHTWQNINRPKSALVRWVTRASLRHADAVLCANREGIDVLRQMGYGGPADVIPPLGVDTRVFLPSSGWRHTEGFTILYAGRLVPEKGLDVLLEAMRRLDASARLVLAGAGPSLEYLRAQVAAWGLGQRVTYLGALPAERLAEQMRAADALVLPSRTTAVWKEQFGRVLIEAMACGLAVIGSDSGAIPEVIGEAGLIFREGDADALAGCLRALYESPTLREELAGRGLERVARLYSQERVAEQTAAFYRGLMC